MWEHFKCFYGQVRLLHEATRCHIRRFLLWLRKKQDFQLQHPSDSKKKKISNKLQRSALGMLLIYQHAKSQCCECTGSMITKNKFMIQQKLIFLSSTLSYQHQRCVQQSFSAKLSLKIASNTVPLAIVIEPYSMDCLSESYSKAEQNHISQAMLLFYSLMAFSITMATGKPH